MTDTTIQELILERLDKIDSRLSVVESKVNYAMGFFAAVSIVSTFLSVKIYSLIFG